MNDIATEVRAEFVAAVQQRKAEIEDEQHALDDELDDLIYDARNAFGSAFPATLKCGCQCELETECDGDSIWTNRLWKRCERHQHLRRKT